MRNNITYYEIKEILESGYPLPKNLIDYLLSNDVLKKLMRNILPGYCESDIHFEPSYKRNPITGTIQLEKKKFLKLHGRLPGYADRIIYNIKYKSPEYKVRDELYDLLKVTGNDHYPVIYMCRVLSFSIGIVTWNIGSGNPKSINQELLIKYFEDFGEYTDVFIIGFQESSIYTKPNLEILKSIYKSSISIRDSNIKSFVGHLIGFGLETCILWNNVFCNLSEYKEYSSNETITKGAHFFKFVLKNCRHKLSLAFSNIHAPFTEDSLKYNNFIRKINDKLEDFGSSDIKFIFGDLNSRTKLSLYYDTPIILKKNIFLNKKFNLFKKNFKKQISYIEMGYLLKKLNTYKKIDFSKKSLLIKN